MPVFSGLQGSIASILQVLPRLLQPLRNFTVMLTTPLQKPAWFDAIALLVPSLRKYSFSPTASEPLISFLIGVLPAILIAKLLKSVWDAIPIL